MICPEKGGEQGGDMIAHQTEGVNPVIKAL